MGRLWNRSRLRLMSVVRRADPFAHVWIDHLFPDAFYEILADAWPPMECFWSDRPSRLDLVPKPEGTAPADARAAHWGRLPACIRRVWDFFVIDVNRRVIGPFMHNVFAPEISARLALIERAHQDGVQTAGALSRPPSRADERRPSYGAKPRLQAQAARRCVSLPCDGALLLSSGWRCGRSRSGQLCIVSTMSCDSTTSCVAEKLSTFTKPTLPSSLQRRSRLSGMRSSPLPTPGAARMGCISHRKGGVAARSKAICH